MRSPEPILPDEVIIVHHHELPLNQSLEQFGPKERTVFWWYGLSKFLLGHPINPHSLWPFRAFFIRLVMEAKEHDD